MHVHTYRYVCMYVFMNVCFLCINVGTYIFVRIEVPKAPLAPECNALLQPSKLGPGI